MTCIVGLKHKGVVYVGGDSAGVAGYQMTVRADAKVFKKNGMVFGFTTSFRMGQLLRYSFTPPPRLIAQDTESYLVGPWVDELRKCLTDGGFEGGGQFIFGYEGRLFVVYSDFQVGESVDPFDAVGCGDEIAKGSLFSTAGLPPKRRVRTALEAAARFSAGVRAPFIVERLKP